MGIGSLRNVILVMMVLSICMKGAFGIRFVIDREECLSHDVQYEGDTVQLSFVVIKADGSWHYGDEGVDLLVICDFFIFIFSVFLYHVIKHHATSCY